MNFEEHITWLAAANSGKCYPKTIEEIDTTLPYLKVVKGITGRYITQGVNYQTHDNAPRMPYVARYLLDNVFPFVEGDLTGCYNIQLHDNYSYLKDGKCYNDVLCFGGMKDDKSNKWVVQLPDCYFMGNWGGKYENFKDETPWESKNNKIVFAGTTTGSREPTQNVRINTCLWALEKDRSRYCDFWITNIAQIDARKIFAEVPLFRNIYHPPVPLEEQMKYKYMLCIDGNTTRWNPDVCFMNTLSMCLPSKDMLWYSPLFVDGEHYVGVTTEENHPKELLKTMLYYQNNGNETLRIIQNNKYMASQLFKPEVCAKYTIELFQNIVENR